MKESTIFWICVVAVIILTAIEYSIATSDMSIGEKLFWLG